MHDAAVGGPHDQQRAEYHPGRDDQRLSESNPARLGFGVSVAGQQRLHTDHHHAHHGERGQCCPTVPRDSDGAEGDDRQRHHAIGQRGANRDGDRPR